MDFLFSRKYLLIAGGAIILIIASWLLAGSQTEEPPVETARTEESEQNVNLEIPEHMAEPTLEILETAPTINNKEGYLPANWHQLTLAEKTALNPLDCPPDEEGFVHLRADNGECLGIKAGKYRKYGSGGNTSKTRHWKRSLG